MVKGVNTLQKQVDKQMKIKEAKDEAAAPPADVALLTEIRDLLAKRPAV
jgi:large conductance mechanosensitive channel